MGNIANISQVMMSIKEELLHSIKSSEGVIFLDEVVTQKLHDMAGDNGLEKQREIIKQVIKSTLGLGEKDMILFRENKTFIRKFKDKNYIDEDTLAAIDNLLESLRGTSIEAHRESETKLIVTDSITIELEQLLGNAVDKKSLNENLAIRDAMKERIRAEMGLDKRDVILFVNNKVIIRKFNFQQQKTNEQIGYEQRYNGLPKEELQEMRQELFESEDIEQSILQEIMEELFKGELDFTKLTNAYFLKTYIKTIQKAIFYAIKPMVINLEDIVIEGLGNLMLREHWHFVHLLIAKKLAELVSDRDMNAANFLKYYSGETEVGDENIKYQRPEIIDEDGMKWNSVTILGLGMQQKKLVESYAVKQKTLTVMEQSIEALRVSAKAILDENALYEKEMAATEKEIAERQRIESEAHTRVKEIKEMLKLSSGVEKASQQAELSEISLTQKKLMIKEEALFSRKKRLENTHKLSDAKLQKIDFDINKTQRKLKEESERVANFFKQQGLTEKYDKMLNALSVALTKRKVQIG